MTSQRRCYISTVKALLLNSLLLCLSLVVFLGIIEVLFRIFGSNAPTAPVWSDRPVKYFMPENAQSLQGPAHSVKKGSNIYRIAVVGDSYSYGPFLQWDDTFSARLERLLNLNNTSKKVEVINYGVPSYSTNHEIAVVDRAIKEEADLILLQITLNDPEVKLYRPKGLALDQTTGQVKLTHPIFNYWHSLRFVVTRILNTQTHRQYKEYFFNLFDKYKSRKLFQNSLGTIAGKCLNAKVPIVAAIFPLFGTVVDDNYPFFPLHQKVEEYLDKVKIPHVDISESFRGIPTERLQVLPGRDRHPNEIGHRLAAEALLKWFEDAQIVPREFIPKKAFDMRLTEFEQARAIQPLP